MPKSKALPRGLYMTLRDSCTQLDIVFTAGTSMSLDGRNVKMFSSFVDWNPAQRAAVDKKGFLMWQINGREFLTGDMYFTNDTTGYLIFKKDNQEYLNKLTAQGASFLQKNKK